MSVLENIIRLVSDISSVDTRPINGTHVHDKHETQDVNSSVDGVIEDVDRDQKLHGRFDNLARNYQRTSESDKIKLPEDVKRRLRSIGLCCD